MRFRRRDSVAWLGTGAALVVLALALWTAQGSPLSRTETSTQTKSPARGAPAQQPAAKPPPLELERDAPLLGAPASKLAPADALKRGADNGACLVCHANFGKETLAATHASSGVACTSCHGPSAAHRNDEANVIPPDIMLSTETLDASCERCHQRHDASARAVVARFLEKSTGRHDLKSLVCTTCHGEHRLPVRTVRWDRKSGKLLSEKKR